MERPNCETCGKPAKTRGKGKSGYCKVTTKRAADSGIKPGYVCTECEKIVCATRLGMKIEDYIKGLAINGAFKAGFVDTPFISAVTARRNSIHKHLKYRKTHCEMPGCTTTVIIAKQLINHHKDGNRDNNHPDNLITYCKTCHDLVHANDKELQKNVKKYARERKRKKGRVNAIDITTFL